MKSQENLDTPEITETYENIISISDDYLTNQQQILSSQYNIGSYENYFCDQETWLITFSNKWDIKLKITFEVVWTISKESNTWLWAWDNPHILEKLKNEIIKVAQFWKKYNLEHLTKRKWHADEIWGWEMTAISSYVMQAKWAYKIPWENVYSFIIFKEIIDLR